MKRRVGILPAVAWLAAATVASAAAGEEGAPARALHLIILSGQSNMVRFDPAATLVPALEARLGPRSLIVVKDAEGGEPIQRWCRTWKPAPGWRPPRDPASRPTGDLYERLIKRVQRSIHDRPLASVTFIWMQGETDAEESRGEVYAASLKALIEQLKADLGRPDLNVVIARINDYSLDNKRCPHWTLVRDAQVAVARSSDRYAWVDTDDLNGPGNEIHNTPEGFRTLGERYARQALRLMERQESGVRSQGAGQETVHRQSSRQRSRQSWGPFLLLCSIWRHCPRGQTTEH